MVDSTLLFYFFGYAISSFLGTILFKAVQNNRAGYAFVIEVIQTIFQVVILSSIVMHPSILSIITVSVGAASGTAAAIHLQRWREKRASSIR